MIDQRLNSREIKSFMRNLKMKAYEYLTLLYLFFCFVGIELVKAGGLGPEIRNFGQYKVALESSDGMYSKVVVYKGHKKIYQEGEFGDHYYFGNHFEGAELNDHDVYSGKDINGNKIPDLVLTNWTGGAHCCNFLSIFEMGKTFRKIVTVSGGSYGFKLVDLDKDKIPEIEFWDNPIDYVFASFAHSAQGKTVLKFVNNQYRVAVPLMLTPVPNKKERYKIEKEISDEFKKNNFPHPPYIFLMYMMDLSYSGHFKLALEIAEKTWPSKFPGFKEFKKKFPECLNDSPYWKEFTRGP